MALEPDTVVEDDQLVKARKELNETHALIPAHTVRVSKFDWVYTEEHATSAMTDNNGSIAIYQKVRTLLSHEPQL